MPYITQEDRALQLLNTPGELNYRLTRLIQQYINNKHESYQTYNDIIGALENCKIEFYRRKVAPYEDKKIEENGDVW